MHALRTDGDVGTARGASTPVATWMLLTPAHAAGAVGMVQVEAADLDGTLEAVGIARVRVGGVALRDLGGIDTGLVARLDRCSCVVMPHGGRAVMSQLVAALVRAGIAERGWGERDVSGAQRLFPEARSSVEAMALKVLARAASPLAVDVLLGQHEAWKAAGWREDAGLEDWERWSGVTAREARQLQRLVAPPLVVMMGASNIGKSTLMNALAQRAVSIVADEAGTTRDHVGVMLDMAGLVVRFVDTAGLRDGMGAGERAGLEAGLRLARTADLVIWAEDAREAGVGNEGWAALAGVRGIRGVRGVRVGLRCDLAEGAQVERLRQEGVVAVCARRGEGLSELTQRVRDALIEPELLARRAAWAFWESGGMGAEEGLAE